MVSVMLSFSNGLVSAGISCILKDRKELEVHTVSSPTLLDASLTVKKPDVLLLDFYILENFTSQMTETTKLLLLDTGLEEEKIIHALITKYVAGVIEKNTNSHILIKAITTVSKGHIWINRKIISNLIARLSSLSNLWNLSVQERHILTLLGTGMEDSAIAKTLGTKESRIRVHIENLKKKSNARDRRDLITISKEFFTSTDSGR